MTQVIKEKDNIFTAYKLHAQSREGRDPAWLANLREKAGAAFESLDFPTTRDEEWKYTNVARILKVPYRESLIRGDAESAGRKKLTARDLAPFTFEESRESRLVFINGAFSRGLSNVVARPKACVAGNLAEIPGEHANVARGHLAAYADYRDASFTALNTASVGDGAFVYIPDGKTAEAPIHLLFISTAEEPAVSHPRVLIVAGAGAIATIIESYVSIGGGVYFTNAVTEVVAKEGAVVTHYRLQQESESAFHVATTQVYQERGSNYASYAISLGAEIARHDLNVALTGEDVETTIDGLYVVTGRQHADSHTSVDHQKPHSVSRQLYKGILDGNSRAVFDGKVFVREGALLTDARQLNKNLLLSSDAHVDTKPQLEIFADDVKCAHGATVGQLEDEELFYLAARGITPERARALLTYGFAEDVISRIKLKSAREHLERVVLDKLHQSLPILPVQPVQEGE
ncbi:MAG TPA: Fe-S cluster assembly protein SufD [Blastocatellia bacterium]|jgi:Fe-S cluster assembly protein SufD|nr:Fe-S cluster assembly protein SufD [Blastocatellia bacterium]